MDGGVSRFIRLKKMAAVAMIFCLFSALFASILMISALAGTETGEFCPTCPDWTDLEGWLKKKDAYEKAQMSGQQADSQNSEETAATNEIDPAKSYALPGLITSPASSALQGDRIILDVRPREDYLAGHISGARNLYWKELQKDGILDVAAAEDALGMAGVKKADHLLICSGSNQDEAFVFWALSYLGQNNISLLDGGLSAAKEAGVSLVTNAVSPQQVNYTASIVPWLLVTPDNLESRLSLANVRVLDARDFSDYGMSRLGNESICLSLDKIYDNSRIKGADILKDLFDRRLDPSSPVIVYGTPQAYSLFYSLRLMGYNATLLDGDWWKDTKWAIRNVK